jgi:hypothetical protein
MKLPIKTSNKPMTAKEVNKPQIFSSPFSIMSRCNASLVPTEVDADPSSGLPYLAQK